MRLHRPLAELRGPERLRDVVRQRLSRLPPETAATLELAAVAGPRFELRVLAEAAGLDQRGLAAAVEEAIRSGLVEELPEPRPACRFTHELVRRADLRPDRRHAARRAAPPRRRGARARPRAPTSTACLPELAHHFTLAAPVAGVERAVDYNLRAAGAAIAAAALDEAAARLSTALELGIADPRERARIQVELGHLLNETGRTAEADAMLAASLDAATGLEERGLARARSSTARLSGCRRIRRSARTRSCGRRGGDRDARAARDRLGLAAAGSARYRARSPGPQRGERRGARARARGRGGSGRPGAATRRDRADGTLALPRRTDAGRRGDPPLASSELRSTTTLCSMPDGLASRCSRDGRPLRRGPRALAASGPVLDGADQTILSLKPLRWSPQTKDLTGDPAGAKQDAARRVSQHARRERRGVGGASAERGGRLALRCCDQGDWDEAADYLAYGRQVDRSEPPRGKVYAILRLAARARLAAHRGEIAEALELAQRAVEFSEPRPGSNRTARARLALAEVQRANGHMPKQTPPSPKPFASTRRRGMSPPSRASGRAGAERRLD